MPAFTYAAGSDGTSGYNTSPNPLGATGLVEFGGVRIHDGTFVLEALGGLTDTPEVRVTETERSQDHGSFLAGSFYSSRVVTVEGYTITDTLDQLWPAMDLLRKAFAMPERAGYLNVQFMQPGWSERRFALMRPSGPLVVAPMLGSESRKPMRAWQLVLLAPNPRLYGATLLHPAAEATPFGNSKSEVNNGNFPSPGVWVVNGPAESPELIDDARGRAIRYSGPVATGATLVVDTLERTALLNGGNVYKNLTRFDDMSIPPGGLSYRAVTAPTNPGGQWRYEHRSVWI